MLLDFASGLANWLDRRGARFDLEFFDYPIQAGAFAQTDSDEHGGDPGCSQVKTKAVLVARLAEGQLARPKCARKAPADSGLPQRLRRRTTI